MDSVNDFAEIIICDGGSKDKTLEIAKDHGCKIIYQDQKFKNPDGTLKDFSGARNQCLDEAGYDWFFYIDSDEAVSEELKSEIKSVTESGSDVYIYNVPIRMILDGRIVNYSSNYPGYQKRFFNKKSGARFIKSVHERIVFDEKKFPVKNLKGVWFVFSTKEELDNYYRDMQKYIKMDIAGGKEQSLKDYLKFILLGRSKSVAGIFLRSAKNYLLHGFKESMPPRVELARMRYILMVMFGLTVGQIKRQFGKLSLR